MLNFDLIRVDPTGKFDRIPPNAAAASALEAHLLALRGLAEDLANQQSAVALTGATTLARFTEFYGPVAKSSVQDASLQKPVSTNLGTFEVWPRPPIPSIWDPQTNNWDMVDGASVELFFPQPATSGLTEAEAVEAESGGNTYWLSLSPADQPNPRVRTCEYCFPATSPGKIEGIVLFLTHTRTRIVKITSAGPLPKVLGAEPTFTANPSAWTVAWRPDPDQTSPICLQISYTGDPPHVRDWTWLVGWGEDDKLPPPVVRPGSPYPVAPAHVHVSRTKELGGYVLSMGDEYTLREEEIAASTQHKRDKRFFLAMDRASNPNTGSAGAQKFTPLATYLANRYVRRAESGAFGPAFFTPEHDLVSWRGQAVAAGNFLTDLMKKKKFFKSQGPHGFDLVAVRAAFLRFAGGELTSFGTHGSPNGLNILCFAELADLLVAMQHEPQTWTRLFEIFVDAARIYVSSYHLCGVETRNFCSYRVEHNPDGSRAWREEWKQALAQETTPRAWVYDALVQAALYDDFEGPNKAPRATKLRDVGCSPLGTGALQAQREEPVADCDGDRGDRA